MSLLSKFKKSQLFLLSKNLLKMQKFYLHTYLSIIDEEHENFCSIL